MTLPFLQTQCTRARLAIARRLTTEVVHHTVRSRASAGSDYARTLISWCDDPAGHLARAEPVDLTSLDPDLKTDPGVKALAFPEVAQDLESLKRHQHGEQVYARLKQYIAKVHQPSTRQQAHMLGQHRHDLSDCRSIELSVQNVPRPQRKPYRLVFLGLGPPSAPTGICVVALGEKYEKDDRVYSAKAGPRQGRDEGISNETGLQLELRLLLDSRTRGELVVTMNAHQDPDQPQLTAASHSFLPAWPTLHGPPAGGNKHWWPFSDVVLIGYDNTDGRAALRGCVSVIRFAQERKVPVQVRYG